MKKGAQGMQKFLASGRIFENFGWWDSFEKHF